MSDNKNTELDGFPQERYDEMYADAQSFDRRNPGTGRWDWSAHMDAAESVFIARQLEFIRPALYEKRYPELKSRRLVPYNTSIDPGTAEYTVKSIDTVGKVQVSKSQPDDVETIELNVTSGTMSMFSLTAAYKYTDQEAREAILANMPLQVRKAMGVRNMFARTMDSIALTGQNTVGESVPNAYGLFNQPTTSTYTPASTGAGGLKTWDSKDSDAILLDLNSAGDQVITTTKEIFLPDTWVLPLTSHRLINSRRVGDGTSSTILAYFMANSDVCKSMERTPLLETAGSGSTKRLVAYKNDPEVLEFIVPLEFEQKAPQFVGFAVKTLCHARCGGVAAYQPYAISYADGI